MNIAVNKLFQWVAVAALGFGLMAQPAMAQDIPANEFVEKFSNEVLAEIKARKQELADAMAAEHGGQGQRAGGQLPVGHRLLPVHERRSLGPLPRESDAWDLVTLLDVGAGDSALLALCDRWPRVAARRCHISACL